MIIKPINNKTNPHIVIPTFKIFKIKRHNTEKVKKATIKEIIILITFNKILITYKLYFNYFIITISKFSLEK